MKEFSRSHASDKSLLDHGNRGSLFQIFAAFITSISAFSIGNVIGWPSQISARLVEGEMGFPISQDELGWIGSFVAVGAACMALIIGIICDTIGRKLTKLLLAIPMISGWVLLAWATDVRMLYAGRILTGMSMGAYMVTNPLYINEITQKEIRGILGSLTQLLISAGILFDVIVGKFASIQAYSQYCLAVPIIFLCAFIFMPETPVHHLKKKDEKAALNVLKKLRSEHYDIETEMRNMQKSLSEQPEGNSITIFIRSWKTYRSTRTAFAITLILMIARSCCGIDAITAYTAFIFTNATDFDPSIGTIIVISIQFGVAIVQSLIVDRVGRKILLLISQFLTAISLFMVGVCFLLKNRSLVDIDFSTVLDTLALVALSIYSVGFALGIAPIPLILNAELNPPETKSLVSSFNTFVSWMFIFAITKTFLIMEENLGVESAFLLYGGLSLIAIIFTFVAVPETKGKTSTEIREVLEERFTKR